MRGYDFVIKLIIYFLCNIATYITRTNRFKKSYRKNFHNINGKKLLFV